MQRLLQYLNCFQQHLVTFIPLGSDYFHSRINDGVNFGNSYSFTTTETRPRASWDFKLTKKYIGEWTHGEFNLYSIYDSILKQIFPFRAVVHTLYEPVTVGSFGNMKPEQS